MLITYLIGSIPFGWLTGKVGKGVDLRRQGSGNIGAANTLRVLGFLPAVFVFLLDFSKGFLPVYFFGPYVSADVHSLIALSAVLGHDFSLFLGLKGGKGVATTLGVTLAIDWKIGILILVVWILFFSLTRIASFSSLISLLFLPLFLYFWQSSYFLLGLILFGLAFDRHRTNIERLLRGEEGKLLFRSGGPSKVEDSDPGKSSGDN